MKKEERPWLPPEKQVEVPTGGWEGFRYWLKNVYWYHYRVATIVIAVVLVMLFFLIRDMATAVRPDYAYTVISSGFVSQELLEEVTGIVENAAGDLNGDGEVYVECSALYLDDNSEMGMANRMKTIINYQRDDISLFIVDEGTLAQLLETDFLTELSAFSVGLEGLTVRVDETPVFVRGMLNDVPLYAGIRVEQDGKDQRQQQEVAALIIRTLLDTP